MTVCVAGLCEAGRKLVCVTDQLLTFSPNMSAVDGKVFKDVPIHKNWFALYAANDMGDVHPILERAAVFMCAKKRDLALNEAMDVFTEAFAVRHEMLIEYRVLRRYGFKSFDDFVERGKEILPPNEYRRITRLVNRTTPECEFLIGGFDLMGLGHLFMQDSTGPARGFDEPGWWAIGSGAGEAISALEFQAHRLDFGIHCSEAKCVYHLLSAKFMAEANRLVGEQTFVTCHAFNKPVRYLSDFNIGQIRSMWEKCAIPRLPIGIIRRIPKMLVTVRQIEQFEKHMDDAERKIFGRKLTKPIASTKKLLKRSPVQGAKHST